jgi:hypothetical protein
MAAIESWRTSMSQEMMGQRVAHNAQGAERASHPRIPLWRLVALMRGLDDSFRCAQPIGHIGSLRRIPQRVAEEDNATVDVRIV